MRIPDLSRSTPADEDEHETGAASRGAPAAGHGSGAPSPAAAVAEVADPSSWPPAPTQGCGRMSLGDRFTPQARAAAAAAAASVASGKRSRRGSREGAMTPPPTGARGPSISNDASQQWYRVPATTAEEEGEGVAAQPPAAAPYRVLSADDDALCLRVQRMTLRMAGVRNRRRHRILWPCSARFSTPPAISGWPEMISVFPPFVAPSQMECTTVENGLEVTALLVRAWAASFASPSNPLMLYKSCRQVMAQPAEAQPANPRRFEQEKDLRCADLVILDSHMGGGERDGLPTLCRILALFRAAAVPPPPVVILSGEGEQETVDSFYAAGAARVLRKPARLEDFQMLQRLVERRGSGAGSSSAASKAGSSGGVPDGGSPPLGAGSAGRASRPPSA